MRVAVMAAIAAAALLGACGGGAKNQAKQQLMSLCMESENNQTMCSCAVDALADNLSAEELTVLAKGDAMTQEEAAAMSLNPNFATAATAARTQCEGLGGAM